MYLDNSLRTVARAGSLTVMSSSRGHGKRIRDTFFTRNAPNSMIWTCKCGKHRKDSGRGYENFVSHVRTTHSEEFQNLISNESQSAAPSKASTARLLFYRKSATDIFGWLELIIKALLPFSTVTNPYFRSFSQYQSISMNTLIKYMDKLVKKVEQRIADLLPNKFAILFDAWGAGSTHYIALFVTFTNDETRKVEKILLAFSPFQRETSLNADAHIEFIEFVKSVFGKSLDNIVAIIADNCSVNRSISTKLCIGFIGCSSHRYNLFVKSFIMEYEQIIEKVRKLMKKLSNPVPAGKLRAHTHLSAQVSNYTRWSSTARMLERFLSIREYIEKLDFDDIDSLIPRTSEVRKIEKLTSIFTNSML